MADRKKPNRQSFTIRRRTIDDADRILATAKAIVAQAEVEQKPTSHWSEAGKAFERAASLYRQASLGLLARNVYEQGSHCFGAADEPEAARRCGDSARIVPTYWEASPND